MWLRVATLAAYLLAKVYAAYGSGLTKDWCDIAYVLVHNDAGGPEAAAVAACERFGEALIGLTETALGELSANFAEASAQGSGTYANTMSGLHTELDPDVLANDAVTAASVFIAGLHLGGM